jgi:16S rRNA G966 N2-methylase RsmD
MTRWLTAADPLVLDDDLVVHGDNLAVAPHLPTGAFDLVYLDPPFNTGRARVRRTLRTSAARGRPHGLRRACVSHRGARPPRL